MTDTAEDHDDDDKGQESSPVAVTKARLGELQARLGGQEPPTPPADQESAQPTDEKPAKPPWGDDFDPERAWNTIQALRASEQELKREKQARDRERMSELERLKADNEDLRRANAERELEVNRQRLVAAKGLPADAADFLHGQTPEELERSADSLKRMIGAGQPARTSDFGAGARPNGGTSDEDFSSMLRRAAGRPA